MYAQGRVRNMAEGLLDALRGFDKVAPRMADHMPPLSHYDEFAAILRLFSEAGCAGCRAGGAPLPFCAARTCWREQGVDFCFECSEYPCGRNNYPVNLGQGWRRRNDRMSEVGIEQFFKESLEETRY
jgi:hypothetical protein